MEQGAKAHTSLLCFSCCQKIKPSSSSFFIVPKQPKAEIGKNLDSFSLIFSSPGGETRGHKRLPDDAACVEGLADFLTAVLLTANRFLSVQPKKNFLARSGCIGGLLAAVSLDQTEAGSHQSLRVQKKVEQNRKEKSEREGKSANIQAAAASASAAAS